MRQSRKPRRRSWIWLVAALFFTVGAATAERLTRAPETSPNEAPTTDSGRAGVRAILDPRTGQPTSNPSRAQLQALAAGPRSITSSRSTVGLRPFDLSRGGRGLNLQGRFDTALKVERAADGTFRMTCGDPAHGDQPHSHSSGGDASASPRPSSREAAPVQ